jgi:HEAT repeat protein
MKNILASLALLFALPVASLAQDIEKGLADLTKKGRRELPEIPDLTKGGTKNDRHDWNLGPTGARGWMWGMLLRTDFARQILITQVDKGSPADRVLKVDDVILGIDGKKFNSDARIAFGRAITEAEKKQNRGELKLLRWRDGKTKQVTLKLKVMGSYGKLSPTNCEKSEKIIENACRYIKKNGIGKGLTGHVNALGLLASGDKRYLPMVRDYARSLKVKDAYAMSSWNMGYMNIFLSEYYLLTKDKKVLPQIREIALYLAGGQSLVGTWGHNNAGPGGKLLGYGAMCQPSLSCAVSLILNQKCGIDDPIVEKAIRRSETFFSAFVDKGNIPYGDHSPREVHDSNGRSSLAVIFFDLLGNPDAYRFFARMTIASYGQREEGHTGNYWSYIWGPLGAMRAGPEAAAAFMHEQQWFYDLERRWDGGFTYQGGANMAGSEHTTPNWDNTGARLLTYAMNSRKLQITGNGLKLEKALTGKELEDTMTAGENYSVWHRQGYIKTDSFDSLPDAELIKRLDTWSMPMRIRAAKSLAKKPTNHVPQLIKMLKHKDRSIILGGAYGLEHQGRKAEPAIDALVSLLTHEDEWVRFRAGCALCAIGQPARDKAVPILLKMANKTLPNDPREMNQRYVAFVLWGDGYNGSARGLFRGDMKGVDRELLIPAIRRLIQNQDGLVRNFVARAIEKMSFEDLSPLWGDIAWGVENPSPSGIMFNADIREIGMKTLAKHRFKETVPVTANFVLTMKPHGAQARIFVIMDVLKSFGTEAKSALPTLYKARTFYVENLGPGKLLEFPRWATDEFMKGLNEGIKTIENATETPKDLISFEDIKSED